MLDRTQQPQIQQIQKLFLPQAGKHTMINGMPMYYLSMGQQEILKIDIVFRAGRPFENKKIVARATNALLKEGCKKLTASEIAEEIDYYGSSISTPFGLDLSQITIYTVAKHFESILPILAAVMEAPLFTASELELYSNNSKQRLMVDLSKNDVIAYRTLTEQIFGSNHPYGYNSNDQAFDDLVQKDLQDHFKKCYQSGNGFVLLSGKVGDREIKLLDGYLSNVIPKGKRLEAKIQAEATPPQSIRIEKKNSVQTAIRMGKKLFNRQHEDYPAMYMVNMALGGYFGSRLMSNIREKQGYTYNIYSSLDPMLFDGSFIISTEVGNDFVDNTRKEIHAEIDTLIGEKMPAAELEMLRNYTMGYLLTLLDGTFNQSDWIKMIKSHDIEYEYFNRLVDTVKFIDAEGIRSMAEKYLQPDEFSEVVVGP